MGSPTVSRRVQHRFIPQPRQQAYITSPADITLFGGARGGGKTFGSLGDFWLHSEAHGPDAKGLMLRKTREDLKDTVDRGTLMYGNAAEWRQHDGQYFQFRNGAKLYMAYLENERDAEHYQGWSLTRVYPEEVTQFFDLKGILRLLATLRSDKGIRCQMKMTCNPGGPSHHSVKQMFIDNGPMNLVRDPETGLTRVYIPSRIADNPALMRNDPNYVNRLKAVGSEALVRAWLEGDWDQIEGAFFPEFEQHRHVISPFLIPTGWIRFRSMDWGSAKPFSIGWWVIVQETLHHDGKTIPRGAIVRYREWYGMKPQQPDVGLKMTAEEVGRGIVSRETNPEGKREFIAYGTLDPSAFNVVSGPSIGETLGRHGAIFRRADNTRVSRDKKMGGWDQLRNRLKGDRDGHPMIFLFNHCRDSIRTIPMLQHDQHHPEDLDTQGEDHAADDIRYACMSRPFLLPDQVAQDRNPYLVANAFKLNELRD